MRIDVVDLCAGIPRMRIAETLNSERGRVIAGRVWPRAGFWRFVWKVVFWVHAIELVLHAESGGSSCLRCPASGVSIGVCFAAH